MDNANVNNKKRKNIAVVGAMTAVVGCMNMIVAGMKTIPREPYFNHDIERKQYLDSIISSETQCHNLLRMSKESFFKLVDMCREKGLLQDSRNVRVEEQMAEFLHTIGHNQKNRVINHNFSHSGETISRYFHIVLKAILSLHKDLVKQATIDSQTPPIIQYDEKFWPWFKDCIGAIDGTHIRVNVPANIRNRFRGRKEKPTQNVLAAVTFDLKFTYILAGWEGSAHDARVLDDALTRPNGLKVPGGKYYLVDAGYPNRKGFLAPYRRVRYHVKEWGTRTPTNAQELYNHRHSLLRNSVERAFGVMKKRWKILDDLESFFPYDTQVDLVLACCIIHNHIMGVDPDDTFLVQLEGDLQSQEALAQEGLTEEGPTQTLRLTERERREENREWAEFRLKLTNDMWSNFSNRV